MNKPVEPATRDEAPKCGVTLVACPFCGHSRGYTLSDGDTFRWWQVSCKHCGAGVTECRSDQNTRLNAPKPARWTAADESWNEAGKYAAKLRAAAEKARTALSELLATRDPIVYADALRALDEALEPTTSTL